MRITVRLDTFDCVDEAYAILWLDRESRKWSREGHDVIDLPEWGTLVDKKGSTRVHGATVVDRAICELSALDLASPGRLVEGGSGRARWYRRSHHAPIIGKWHIQCVDKSGLKPESGIFVDGEDV